MILYKCKISKIGGSTKYKDVIKKARMIYHTIEKQSKRNAYIKSAYFCKEKVFLDLFWTHLNQKPQRERRWRLKFLPCAYELIRNSRNSPASKQNPNIKSETLHRFGGVTGSGELFYVQIKENKKTKRRDFMSVFPEIYSRE